MSVGYDNRQYPNRLRVTRKNAGYKQKQVASYQGHQNASQLCLWEGEKIMPNSTSLFKLCILYGKSLQELYPEYYRQVAKETIAYVDSLYAQE